LISPWLVLFPLAAVAGAYLVTGRVLGYATHRLVDVPNDRSSHAVPTPRGGGVSIVVITLVAIVALTAIGVLPWTVSLGMFGAGLIVAGIGFADDHRHVHPGLRLLAHFVAAAWLVGWIGPVVSLPIAGRVVDLSFAAYPLAILYVVWVLNLSNFMDGIDGIAAIEALTVTVSSAIVYALSARVGADMLVPLTVAGAVLGFLIWNWPPARIFMGDVGSGFLGVMMAALSLEAAQLSPRLFWAWLILLGVFIVDATVTLVRRTVRGDRFYEAHRTHAYQHAAVRFGSHRRVTIATGLITLIWLLPIAIVVGNGTVDGALGLLAAYIPLIALVLWLKAGQAMG